MNKKMMTPHIRSMKNSRRISALTAHDFTMARLADKAGADVILVGDSLAMYAQGHSTTLPATLEEMIYHSRCASRGVEHALLVADMPFLTYQASEDDAIMNAGRFLKEGGADAVKVEGGTIRANLIRRMTENGIPVMGHIGLTPQSVHAFGGFKVQGRTSPEAEKLLEDAKALQEAGVFSFVLECVPAELGRLITQSVDVPVIGIGAGPNCDGQILVTHDVLGLCGSFQPKFVKRYAELGDAAIAALSLYCEDVSAGTYPSEEHCY